VEICKINDRLKEQAPTLKVLTATYKLSQKKLRTQFNALISPLKTTLCKEIIWMKRYLEKLR